MGTSTWPRLAAINRFATLSAYVADIPAATIRLHASVSMTAENYLLARAIALHAMALQIADAHAEAQELAEAFGATVAASPHPVSGPRDTPDEMVRIGDVYQERGDGDSPFDRGAGAAGPPRAAAVAAGRQRAAPRHADLDFAAETAGAARARCAVARTRRSAAGCRCA